MNMGATEGIKSCLSSLPTACMRSGCRRCKSARSSSMWSDEMRIVIAVGGILASLAAPVVSRAVLIPGASASGRTLSWFSTA